MGKINGKRSKSRRIKPNNCATLQCGHAERVGPASRWLKKRTWRLIYLVTAVLTPPVCMLVFLGELAKCENVLHIVSLYILEIAVCLLFLPSYKYHYQKHFFIGWLISFFGVAVLIAISGVWEPIGIALTISVPIIPLLGITLEPLVSKLKYHLLARALCVGLIVLVRSL